MLVLPPFQSKGLGGMLLENVYVHYLKDQRIQIIKVEEPAFGFQVLKDSIDCKLLYQKGFFRKLREQLMLGYVDLNQFFTLDQKELTDAKRVLKLTKANIIRCYELCLIAHLPREDMRYYK